MMALYYNRTLALMLRKMMKRLNGYSKKEYDEIIYLLEKLPPECEAIVVRELRLCVRLLEGDYQAIDIHRLHQYLDRKLTLLGLPTAN